MAEPILHVKHGPYSYTRLTVLPSFIGAAALRATNDLIRRNKTPRAESDEVAQLPAKHG